MALTEELRKSILFTAVVGGLTEHDDSDLSVLTHFQSEKINCVEESVYSVPDNWCVLSLDSIVDIKNGFTPKRSIKEFWDKNEVPWFTVEDVNTQGHIIRLTNQYITYQALGKSTDRIIPADTVLLCCTSATIGNYALTKIPLTTNQQWNGLVIKTEHKNFICSEYLLCWVQTLKEKLINIGGSTTFPFVSIKKLSSFPVPVPPIEEQQRIVDRVNVLMEKLDEFSEIEQQLLALKANFPADLRGAILQAAMQGKLTEQLESDTPVEQLLKSIENGREQLLSKGAYKQDKKLQPLDDSEIPFDIPDSWSWVKLGYCSTYGQTKQKATIDEIKSDIWSLDLEDIEKTTGRLLCKQKASQRKINGDKVKFFKGNILYSKLRPYLLKILIADDDGICTPELIPFDMIGDINPRYILWVLRSPHVDYKINAVTYGVKMPRVGTDTMVNLLIPLPPIEEQQRIVEHLDALLPLCDTLV